ncbi:L2 [Micromys minutus papillomavirus 1]|uniref:Minor capsid protein L2 n=1 Tax=Micromys minutus papillomavirus TaxID=10568 RepID=A0EPK8_MMPV|nr:L2 [Micromys minutus papillomavirus 1]ABB85357.1 L2 [Micromys minutus papillomavirus 1]
MVAATRAKRVKRDSAPNLYRQCQVTGNCPPDVVNKVEGNTLADKLLKIFSSIIYLGGLGIGTGSGSGETFGYGSINPGGGRITGTGTVMRPGVTIEPIGPSDIVPVSPGDTSIVPLLEATPDVPIDGGPEVPPPGPDISTVDVTSTIDNVSDVNVSSGTTITNADSAVIDVQPAPTGPRRVTVSRSSHNNPAYVSVSHQSQGLGEGGGFVVAGESSGILSSTHEIDAAIIVGGIPPPETIFEDIELDSFSGSGGYSEFGIEDPLSSTPRTPIERAVSRFRDLYNRRVEQVRVTNQAQFLENAGRAVTFENPAYSPDDISLIFEQDVAEVSAAPDPLFTDIIRLGRQRLSETADRTVRVSRLGQRGTIRTRSGLQIGGKVHYYTDLSPVVAENIELSTLGELSGEAELVDGIGNSSFIGEQPADSSSMFGESFELLDVDSIDLSNSRLEFTFRGPRTTYTVPIDNLQIGPGMYLPDIGTGTHVIYPGISDVNLTNLSTPEDRPGADVVVVPEDSVDYYLHPSLRKRKRKYVFH